MNNFVVGVVGTNRRRGRIGRRHSATDGLIDVRRPRNAASGLPSGPQLGSEIHLRPDDTAVPKGLNFAASVSAEWNLPTLNAKPDRVVEALLDAAVERDGDLALRVHPAWPFVHEEHPLTLQLRMIGTEWLKIAVWDARGEARTVEDVDADLFADDPDVALRLDELAGGCSPGDRYGRVRSWLGGWTTWYKVALP